MKYILNSNCPENWGSEAYNGMEITQDELERLASEWDTPISELMSDLKCVPDDDESDELMIHSAHYAEQNNDCNRMGYAIK